MLDEAIETHIREKLQQAYPELESEQILVRFPQAVFEKSQSKRGNAIGAERLTAIAIISNGDKLDRLTFIKLVPRCRIDLGGVNTEQNYVRAEQKDYIELIQMKGLIFTLQYVYDIIP